MHTLSQPLIAELLVRMDACWRPAYFLPVRQINLDDPTLLKRPLTPTCIRPRLLDHCKTTRLLGHAALFGVYGMLRIVRLTDCACCHRQAREDARLPPGRVFKKQSGVQSWRCYQWRRLNRQSIITTRTCRLAPGEGRHAEGDEPVEKFTLNRDLRLLIGRRAVFQASAEASLDTIHRGLRQAATPAADRLFPRLAPDAAIRSDRLVPRLRAGDMLYLEAVDAHAVKAVEDSYFLLTIVRPGESQEL